MRCKNEICYVEYDNNGTLTYIKRAFKELISIKRNLGFGKIYGDYRIDIIMPNVDYKANVYIGAPGTYIKIDGIKYGPEQIAIMAHNQEMNEVIDSL